MDTRQIGYATILTVLWALGWFLVAVFMLGYSTASFGIAALAIVIGVMFTFAVNKINEHW